MIVVAVVFFAIAGALGGSVADRLDPYGADDPATGVDPADERLEDAGYRDASVVVLMRDTDPTHAAPGRGASRRSSAGSRPIPRSPASPATPRPAAPTSSPRTATSTYLAVSLTPTDDKEQQEAGTRIEEDLSGEPGVTVGGYALATEQVNKQVEEDLRTAEMLAFPLLFLLSFLFFRSGVAAMLPLMIGALAIVGTFLLLRIGKRAGLDLDLRPQPDHRPGPGPGDRLQPVRGLAIPRGDREDRPGVRGDEADHDHGRADRPLLVADRAPRPSPR